jgi:TolB-like protein
MRHLPTIMLLAATVASVCPSTGLAADATPKLSVAVTDLSAEGLNASEAKVITDRLRTELLATGVFTVVERGQMEEILKEQGFQQSGCVSDQCVVEAGQLLGVNHILAGSLGQVGKTITMNVRLVEVATGQIAQAVNIDCRCAVEDVLQQTCRQVAEELAARVTGKPVTAQPAKHPSKRRQVLRRVIFGTVAAACLGGGLWMNSLAQTKTDDLAAIEKQLQADYTPANRDRLAPVYQQTWDDGHTLTVIRNLLYGGSGAFAAAFVVSIPF